MKKLVLRFLLLVAPFALYLGVCEYRVSKHAFNQIAAKKQLFEERKRDIKVLVMGSSHPLYGILPESMCDSAFSLAAVNQSLYYDEALLRKCVDQMPSLKVVVLPVSYFSLGTQLDASVEKWRTYSYRYTWGIQHRDWHMAWQARNFSAFFLCGKDIGRLNAFAGHVRDLASDYDSWGGWTNRAAPEEPKDWDQEMRLSAETRLQRHHGEMRPEFFVENKGRLDNIGKLLAARHIDLVLVTLPVTRFYADGMDPAALKEMQTTLAAFCAKYNARYLDYTADTRFSAADFGDADHLSLQGARKFSTLLGKEISSEDSLNRRKESVQPPGPNGA